MEILLLSSTRAHQEPPLKTPLAPLKNRAQRLKLPDLAAPAHSDTRRTDSAKAWAVMIMACSRVEGLGFQGLGFRVSGLGLRIKGFGCRAWVLLLFYGLGLGSCYGA